MTLHWWMHWFWVTAQIVVSLTSPSERSPPEQTSMLKVSSVSPTTSSLSEASLLRYSQQELLAKIQQNYRVAKAIGLQMPINSAEVSSERPAAVNFHSGPSTSNLERTRTTSIPLVNKTTSSEADASGAPVKMPSKKESKSSWANGYSKSPKPTYDETTSTSTVSSSGGEEMTVMPLQEHTPGGSKSLDPNAIDKQEHLLLAGNHSGNQRQLLLQAEKTIEPQAVATAASILDAGLIDSTRLGRARGAFSSEFQRDQLSREEQRDESKGQPIRESADSGANVTEIATITGSCLAVVVLLSTVGSLSFIMYRRRYLNPPQTLNSDKCSNPDSSGYIDDSTIRDNSEEMYSLDNDSFLNSLEAMTIQNYWTDSVKHTKL
ncbi:uncharacterized protein LOC131666681 [Phymastichus coffea]|uniref:uncharacterized protein LOC131666681 n=1 Tax=Phymastichus coffea TaxID=108790 RepID=UPI00273A7D4A|nr:uncharacterized protein LOC131666681 [Phymastichus coffea]XP_058795505.1 uncharacterized protein LOC131666681 [Phymastichus coffea]